jgi:alanine dehydrogenase
MLIGVPREIKVHEYRVGLTPESVSALVARGIACSSSAAPALVSEPLMPTTNPRARRLLPA